MQRIQLEADGACHVLTGNPGECQLAHDRFAPRQQHRGTHAAGPQRFQEPGILRAPFGRRPPGEIAYGDAAEYANLGGAHPDGRHFEVRGADRNADSRAECQQLAKVFGNGNLERHRGFNGSKPCRTTAGCG